MSKKRNKGQIMASNPANPPIPPVPIVPDGQQSEFQLPIVEFSDRSASGVECAMSLAKMMVGGQIIETAFNRPVEVHLTVARTVNWLLVMIANKQETPDETSTRLSIEDPQTGHALLALQDMLQINAAGLGGGIFRDLILQKLIEFGMKYFEEWLRRKLPTPQPQP